MGLANYLVFEACSNTVVETLAGKIFYWKIAGNFIINYFVILIIIFYVILMHTFGLLLFVFIFTWLEGLFLKKLLNGKKKRKFGEKN